MNKRTPFYEDHKKRGAKIVPFAGWEMALSFSGVLEEHRATRSDVGLFDVSHMARLEVNGVNAALFLDRMITRSLEVLKTGEIQYALALNEQGGILDDLMIYRMLDHRYMVCANASNADKIFNWFTKHASGMQDVKLTNRTTEIAQLAVQGPRSRELLEPMTDIDLRSLKPRRFLETKVAGVPMFLSRGGYTGELGYELFPPVDRGPEVWRVLMEKGETYHLKPCGLGCRDTLRLEMGYPLYGNDIDETTTPIEASLEFAVSVKKEGFIGSEVVLKQKEEKVTRKLVGFELLERGVPRHGYTLHSKGQEVGVVTSGNHSPSLNKGIGMGYVLPDYAPVGTKLFINIRGKTVPAVVVERPFYRRQKT